MIDDHAVNDTFASTATTFAYDYAGNLTDDGYLTYTYDAWNRLVKVQSKIDSDIVVQTAEYDTLGEPVEKTVSSAGDLDGNWDYFYNGARMIEVRTGSNEVDMQLYHGTQNIDELVGARLPDGYAIVNQDANWNSLFKAGVGWLP